MMSTLPNVSIVFFTQASTSALSATLQPMPIASEPRPLTMPTVSSHHSALRSTTATFAPRAASVFAIIWPMPRAAPVTMATLPSRFFSMILSLIP